MNDDISHLENDIARTRARLDETIDRLQSRLSVSGIVDDVLGQTRHRYGSTFDLALDAIRRNPVPVMLIAAGVGWLIHRMTEEPRRPRRHVAYSDGRDAASGTVAVPVTVTGIEPLDAPPLPGAVESHPMPDRVALRRNTSPRL
jgi:hypothetical protein